MLAHLGLAYERVEVDTRAHTNREALLGDKNPALRVPVLTLDDGRHLAESNAILWYLADGSEYVPADRFERAQVLQWMFFEQYSHEPYIAVVRHRALTGHLDLPDTEERREKGYKALEALEGRLAGRDFLVGRLHDRRHRAVRVHARRWRWRLRPRPLPGHLRLARTGCSPAGASPSTPDCGDRRVAQLRRFLVAHQGYATRTRHGLPT
jgi:hypothetical protein